MSANEAAGRPACAAAAAAAWAPRPRVGGLGRRRQRLEDRLAAVAPAAYVVIATASWTHISMYWASVAMIAGVLMPRKLVATSAAS